MKAVVFRGVGDIRLEDVPEPELRDPMDAIVRLSASAICGTDLHMVRGTLSGMKPGTILGHEGVGTVEQVGRGVRNFEGGERVVIGSTVACGYCSYCRAGYFSQCDNANPKGKGTAFFGGPEEAGGLPGMQAELVRVPFANVTMVKLPDEVSDQQAIMISDIFPTGYFGADLAQIHAGSTVAVFGCGPVGQFTIWSALHKGAGRVLAVDTIETRLAMARAQGAETIDYNREDPVEAIQQLTGGIGVDRAIDAVGVDANAPTAGPAAEEAGRRVEEHEEELRRIAPEQNPRGGNWLPGDAPSQVLEWAVKAVAKAGTVAIIGVYPETAQTFPVGQMMMKNLTVRSGNCPHRRYIPRLVEMVRTGVVDPTRILTEVEPLARAVDAYKAFDERRPGWLKVELLPAA
jgi:threonine dehydrogenase-like Zn-dependent dehydrogenase